MLAQQRQVRILTELRRAGAVRVADLTDLLGVSDMTIRRDLVQLAADGVAQKVYGSLSLLLAQLQRHGAKRRAPPIRIRTWCRAVRGGLLHQ